MNLGSDTREAGVRSSELDFDRCFKALTGHDRFPWQRALYEERFLNDDFPDSCDIPTGLGKTATITVWLLALAHHALANTHHDFPRRLVYVVNRRTVVDQATREAEQMRKALASDPNLRRVADALSSLAAQPTEVPLAISTLRGQFADNAEWRDDPARPAVIVGTVDMIGSRLLFSGYGRGFKSRPLHAGFLGQDTLLVHDEAHLEPAFQELITAIESEQQRRKEFRRFRVMALTATSRGDGGKFGLTEADRKHNIVKKRISARKRVSFHRVDDEKDTADQITKLALIHEESGHAILVFLRKLEDVHKVASKLPQGRVQTLTGTMRGLERDRLAKEDTIFARFMPKPEITPQKGTVYLVCTSAGEVGVNISADHLVSDLTPFDSMAQRLGRVNRFGDGDARIDVVYPNWPEGTIDETVKSAVKFKDQKKRVLVLCSTTDQVQEVVKTLKDSEFKLRVSNQNWLGQTAEQSGSPAIYGVTTADRIGAFASFEELVGVGDLDDLEVARLRTLGLLQSLPVTAEDRRNASPAALSKLSVAERQAAFTPPPTILPASDILFDAWTLTSVRRKLPGRPPVADWLHGVADWEPPETHVAWREEVGCLTDDLRTRYKPEDLLEDFPLKPHELLRDRSDRVFAHLKKLAEAHADRAVWLIVDGDSVTAKTLGELANEDKDALDGRTVLLPPEVGGLLESGMLSGSAAFEVHRQYDVADRWEGEDGHPHRLRVWDDDKAPDGMRIVCTIDIRPDAEDEEVQDEESTSRRYWRWYVRLRSADDDGSRTARKEQKLAPHLQAAERFAAALAAKLVSEPDEASGVRLAAKWHDLGKHRSIWQRSIGNHDANLVLAKSGGKARPLEITDYRHELGSLIDVSSNLEFRQLTPGVQDLVLHLIAAHHGRARPHFPADESFDPERLEECTAEVVREVPRRFARLQRKYGRWGLAYLESLVRAADALASQDDDPNSRLAGSSTVPAKEVAR